MFDKRFVMSYNLVYYGNETLAAVAEPVDNIDGTIASLIDEMFIIMHRAIGIGLAAPQIDLGKRVIVVDTGEGPGTKMALVNPVIKEKSESTEPFDEGCLSLPGINADVIRPSSILISGFNRDGKEVEFEADGLIARVLQHEVDHLDGIVFVDRIEKYRRDELRSQLKRIKKMNK
jgi:peptide deformylase